MVLKGDVVLKRQGEIMRQYNTLRHYDKSRCSNSLAIDELENKKIQIVFYSI
jgi:hypothetical protein